MKSLILKMSSSQSYEKNQSFVIEKTKTFTKIQEIFLVYWKKNQDTPNLRHWTKKVPLNPLSDINNLKIQGNKFQKKKKIETLTSCISKTNKFRWNVQGPKLLKIPFCIRWYRLWTNLYHIKSHRKYVQNSNAKNNSILQVRKDSELHNQYNGSDISWLLPDQSLPSSILCDPFSTLPRKNCTSFNDISRYKYYPMINFKYSWIQTRGMFRTDDSLHFKLTYLMT